jgi:transposase-like protein
MNNDHHPSPHRPEPTSVAQEMAATVARYRASGLGLHRFAREQGISPSQLHYWVYHRKGGGRKNGLVKPTMGPVFQEIQLPARSESTGGWAAEVGLPGGRVVRFSASASAQWIASIIQAL